MFGYGVCLAYINEKGRFDFIEVDPFNAVFGKNIALRFIQDLDDDNKEIIIAEVFDKQDRYYYTYKDGSFTALTEYNGVASGSKHMFNDIPLFKFKNNKEELSETYRVRNIINTVDTMYSGLAGELEQFRLAYIKFVGCEPTEEQIASMVQTGAIALREPNSDVGFITKVVDIQGILEAIDKEVQNIYKFAQTYDAYHSREGYGQLTNLGIHFLMAPLNNNCKKTIHYFKESLYQLFDFYSQTVDGNWLDPLEMSFNFTLDTPRNILEESQVQRNLEGIVSSETRLGLATFVDDPLKELERIEKEGETEDIFKGLGEEDDTEGKEKT